MITSPDIKKQLISVITSGIDAVKPDRLIRKNIRYSHGVLYVKEHQFDLTKINKVYIIGFGKVSAAMAFEMEALLCNRITKGVVITNHPNHSQLEKIIVRVGNHPILDEKVLAASEEILNICKEASENDLVICLISGGGSALFEKIPDEIELGDLQIMTKLLLKSGATINEINKIRKCISLVKKGGLLRFISPARCISLIISDVVGDNIGAIASGPTFIDGTSIPEAFVILKNYNLLDSLPPKISGYFHERLKKNIDESVFGENYKVKINNFIIGSNYEALIAAEKTAKSFNLNTMILSGKIQGEASQVGKIFASIIEEIKRSDNPVMKPACFIAGGETTVTVTGKGIGGRNQELALATFISLLDSKAKFGFASCGTDGLDGMTSAAGGYVDYNMIKTIVKKKINPIEYLTNNDSFNFLKAVEGLIFIPPGQTNVMDLMVGILI